MRTYQELRPATFSQVYGQDTIIKALSNQIEKKELSHTILFQGGSGTGKTTVARIIGTMLGCSDSNYNEINCADFRGIDTIREIRSQMRYKPVEGGSVLWVIDEVSQMTIPAQNAFLKLLEDTPSWGYFVLCTTDPKRLIKTIKTRCTEYSFNEMSVDSTIEFMQTIIRDEDLESIPEEILEELAEGANGSHRKSVVLLGEYYNLDKKDQKRYTRTKAKVEKGAIDLCRLLMGNPTWKEITSLINSLEGNLDSIKYIVFSYYSKVLVGDNINKSRRAYNIINAFKDYEDLDGTQGIAMACFSVFEER